MQSSLFLSHSPLVLVVPPLLLVSLFSFFFILILITLFQLLWNVHPKDRKLPPGSMGWPYLGETFKLYTENPNSFFSNRQKRYGDIFKTYILGCPCVMISSPEAAKIVLVSKAHLFKPTYPPSKEKLIGPEALFFHQGEYHSKLKKLVQASFLPCALMGAVSEIESIVLNFLPTWENNKVNTLREMKKYTFDVAMISAFGNKGEVEIESIRHLYQCLEKGYNSMPLNFPGTPFHKAIKARKLLNEKLKKLIARRRKNDNIDGGLLGVLLKSQEQKSVINYQLSDSQIADNVIGVIFAAHDTTASVLTWVLKYLHDNEQLLQDVTLNDIYDELVHEMEEILFQSEQSSSLNGGNSSACTSGFEDDNPLIHHALRIDGVEVVGAKQRKGDIRVWRGKNRWEVERRYREFYALYHQLKTSFAAREWILPLVWSNVDKESRKFFGNTSPNVVAERSSLIQECKEQIGVRQRLIEANRGLTWEDTRNMPFTSRVIQETLRTASILSFTFREAVHDVEFEGYLIPKGWKVLPLFRSIHHCADFFPQPEKFDPSRFEVPPRPNTYMPFGNGVHSCPGSELAKLEMLILLHHLTITYRWKVVGDEDGIQYGPFPVPKNGFPIMVHPRK